MSTELIQRADAILKEDMLPDRHSYFQIEKFIIGKEVTAQAQMWQIIRELDARRETVGSLQEQIEDAEDQLELFEIEIEKLNIHIRKLTSVSEQPDQFWYITEERNLEIRATEINIRKTERKKAALGKAAQKVSHKLKSVLEEMNCLIAAYDKVILVAGECKPFDDRDAQREMWNEKFLEEFNMRALLNRPLDPDFVKSIMALDDDSSVKAHTVQLLTKIQTQILANNTQTNAQTKAGLPKVKPQNITVPQKRVVQKIKPKTQPLPKGGVFSPHSRRAVRGKPSITRR